MKSIVFFLSLVALTCSCKTNRPATTSPESKAANDQSDNPLLAFCACKNSKGLTVDAYGKIESEAQNLSLQEYAATLSELTQNHEHWFFKDFIQDETYLINLKSVEEKFKNNKASASAGEEDAQKMMAEVMEKFPVCWELFPFMLTMAKEN